MSDFDPSYLPPKRVMEWAEKEDGRDSLATAYCGICTAISSIQNDAVTSSTLFASKKRREDQDMDESVFSADDDLDDCALNLFAMRNELAKIIERLLDK